MCGLKGCRTVRGWSTLDIEEVLDPPGMPADGCAARVRQLRALADPPSRGLAPRASSPRAEPLPADGFLLDLASMNADERRDAARLKALASAEAKKQGVARPVAYVVMPSYLHAKEVVEFAARDDRQGVCAGAARLGHGSRRAVSQGPRCSTSSLLIPARSP